MKVGDKVKVVRKFKSREGDSEAFAWDFDNTKASMQNKTGEVKGIERGYIIVDKSCFPYFALEPAK